MSFRNIVAFACLGSAFLLGSPARAVTETYRFVGTNFGGSVGPSDVLSVTGEFTVTYDHDVSGEDLGLVDSFRIDTDHPSFNLGEVHFGHFNSGGFRNLFIGGSGASLNTLMPNTPRSLYFLDIDFNIAVAFNPDGALSPFNSISYTSRYPQPHGIYTTGFMSAVITPAGTGPVPEPATWAMMIAGFGMAGGMMRRGAGKATCEAALRR